MSKDKNRTNAIEWFIIYWYMLIYVLLWCVIFLFLSESQRCWFLILFLSWILQLINSNTSWNTIINNWLQNLWPNFYVFAEKCNVFLTIDYIIRLDCPIKKFKLTSHLQTTKISISDYAFKVKTIALCIVVKNNSNFLVVILMT